ncbi:MAG: ABC transporter substrate-binding protein [Clostridiaceae bacterium]
MKKKINILVGLVMTASMVVTACTSTSTSTTASGTQGGSTTQAGNTTQAGVATDTITWGQGSDVTSFDPHTGKETYAVQVTNHIFDTLTQLDETGKVVGQIAESWTQPDNVTTIFKIRKGIKVHDGTELTAEDVKYSLDRAIASAAVSYIVNFIDTVKVDDPYTVTVKTKEAYAPILRNLAVPFSAIIPKAYAEKMKNEGKEFATKPIGSGPYKLVEWKQGDSTKLERFDEYYAGPAKTKNLVMKVIPEAAQRTIALETGELDLVYDVQANDVQKIKDNSNLVYYEADPLTCFYLAFNTKKAPFDNKLVRQAIRHAIDSQTIIDTILYGNGIPAGDLIAPKVFGYADDASYSYDPELAKKLLADAGYANGINIKLSVNDAQIRVEVSQAIAAMLQQVGINCEVEVTEFGKFIDSTSNGEHDMAYMGWITSTLDADYTYFSLAHSTQAGRAGNRSFFNNSQADELINKGRYTIDEAQRKQFYAQLEDILQEESPYGPVFYTAITVGASKQIQGFVPDPIGYHKLENVTVAK